MQVWRLLILFATHDVISLFTTIFTISGFSDEETPKKPSPSKNRKKAVDLGDDLIPSEKATSALDNLLNNSPSHKKTKQPTMLEQMMSGNSKRKISGTQGILTLFL